MRLLYEREVLWARFAIRDRYLREVAREVYDNIGQVLTLVRVELSLLSMEDDPLKKNIQEPGRLVGKAIADLRHLCRAFSPETELLGSSFITALQTELRLLMPDQETPAINIIGTPVMPETGQQIILLRLVQEMLLAIREQEPGKPFSLELQFRKKQVALRLGYEGEPVQWEGAGTIQKAAPEYAGLSFTERVSLIGGKLVTHRKKNNLVCFELLLPYKHKLYE